MTLPEISGIFRHFRRFRERRRQFVSSTEKTGKTGKREKKKKGAGSQDQRKTALEEKRGALKRKRKRNERSAAQQNKGATSPAFSFESLTHSAQAHLVMSSKGSGLGPSDPTGEGEGLLEQKVAKAYAKLDASTQKKQHKKTLKNAEERKTPSLFFFFSLSSSKGFLLITSTYFIFMFLVCV